MEWVLQVVDEIDDAVGAVRHGWLGFHVQTTTLVVGIALALAAAARSAMLKMRPRQRAHS